MNETNLLERITVNPKVMVGKPLIKGTRITVEFVLGLLAHGAGEDEIIADWRLLPCGIMCRMENSNPTENEPLDQPLDPDKNQNIEDTHPWRLGANAPAQGTDPDGAESSDADAGETRATPTASAQPQGAGSGDVDAGSTRVTPVERPLPAAGLENPPKGYEMTAPYEVEPPAAPPAPAADQAPPNPPKKPPLGMNGARPARRGRLPWFVLPLVGIAFLLVVLLVSGFGGYQAGIGQRKNAEKTQVAIALDEQFQLGLQDMQQGVYDRARQRFEYVIKLDPGYPGASDRLAEVLLELNTTATPTLLPTTTLTPTPDTRDVEQLYNQAQQALAGEDWSGAIDNLLALRKSDPSYRTVEVDGNLFLALRNRGRDQILKDHNLEGGIYDLTLAEKFGPLDSEAQGLLSWSSLYITGASFWDIDWEQAVNYFSQVAPQLPNLMDASMMTATERLRLAYFEWGNTLAGRGQYCQAVKAYQNSIAIAPDAKVQQAGELAASRCEGGGQAETTPKPNKKPKATASP